MMGTDLPNKPLVEALLEIKWGPAAGTAQMLGSGWSDPNYPVFLGIFYNAIKNEFPVIEDQPAKQLPDMISPGMVKTRFRAVAGGWPVVQAGPGILSVNFTSSYTWSLFQPTALKVVASFLEAYTSAGTIGPPKLTSALLRYIDGIETAEFQAMDTLTFVRDKLHVGIDLPDEIHKGAWIGGPLSSLDLRLAIPLVQPKGRGNLRVATGQKEGKPAILCDTSVLSRNQDTPQTVEDLEGWLEQSHVIVMAWFESMVKGDLMELFGRSQ